MVPQLAPASSSLSPAPAAVVHYPGLSQLAHPVPSETDATASRADDSKAKEATQPSAAPDALVVLIDSASLMEEVLSKFQDFVDETQSLLVVLRSARSHEPGSPRSTKNDDVPTEGKQEREGEILGPESEEGFRQRFGDDERDFEDGEHDRGDTGSSSEDGASLTKLVTVRRNTVDQHTDRMSLTDMELLNFTRLLPLASRLKSIKWEGTNRMKKTRLSLSTNQRNSNMMRNGRHHQGFCRPLQHLCPSRILC